MTANSFTCSTCVLLASELPVVNTLRLKTETFETPNPTFIRTGLIFTASVTSRSSYAEKQVLCPYVIKKSNYDRVN